MARASTPTLLALDRYAQVMGVPPPHFNQAVGGTIFPAPGGCSQVWFQYSWQAGDRVAREDLALAIANAEEDIAEAIGYWPAPKFISEEAHRFPRHHRPDVRGNGFDARGFRKGLKLNYGKVIQAGRRAVSFVGTATTAPGGGLVFDDLDLDTFDESATITLPTTLTDPCEIKVYFTGHNGDPEWEIRPARSVEIIGPNVVITFWCWQLINPVLWEALPTTTEEQALDLAGAIYVADVEVYREYVDSTVASAEFFWEPSVLVDSGDCCHLCGGAGCEACALTSQEGCIHLRDPDLGLVAPTPASYNAVTGWSATDYTECREPDMLKLWYYAGALDNLFLAGRRCDPLSDFWAEVIAWIATARLERPFCACGNLEALALDLRTDLAVMVSGGASYVLPERDLDNPFGTRRGEVKAWRKISRLVRHVPRVAVI